MTATKHILNLRLILALLLIFSASVTIAQNEKYFFDKDWLNCSKNEAKYYRIIEEVDSLLKVTDYYKSGRKQFEGYIENKAKNFEVLKIRGDFKQKTVGICTYFRKNGKKDFSINMRPFDQKSGVDSVYLSQLDSLDTVGVDLSELEFQINYYNGKEESGFIFDEDTPHGNWVEIDVVSGSKLYQTHYTRGKMNGISAVFYASGVLKELSYYVNGELHGERRKYNRKGILVKGEEYEKGDLKETWIYQKPKKKKKS